MEILIAIAVIVALIVMFNGGGVEPNVENFTPDQMIRHVKSLQNWIDRHEAIQNPSDSIKAELQRKRAQYDHAMAVWKRKIEEANTQSIPRELSSEENEAKKMALFIKKLRDLTLRLAHKRIAMQEGENVVGFEELQQLSDSVVSALPESNMVTMAALYRRCIGEGAAHEDALQLVNATRLLPVQWKDISKFQSIEEYMTERLKVELGAPSLSEPTLKYYTQDFVSNAIQETNRVCHEIFGY